MKFISSLKSVTFIFWIYWFFSIIRTYALSFDQVSDTTDQLHLSKIITSESLNFIPWRFDREGDTILLSFWDFCCFFFELIYRFKTKVRFGFCQQLLLKLSRNREVKQANHGFLVVFKFFLFSKFLEFLGI